jgi:hypothetical protein
MNMKATYKAITFGEWLQSWFEIYKSPTLRPNSVRNIEQMILVRGITPNRATEAGDFGRSPR